MNTPNTQVTSPDLPKTAEQNTTTALTTVGQSGLTVSRIEELIVAHKAPMGTRAVTRLVQQFALTETDVDMLLEARGEYSAGVAKMRQLLERGFTATQVNSLYEARERINSSVATTGISIAKLLLVRDNFAGADCDPDNLSEIVLAIYEAAQKSRPDISLEAAINTTCYIASRCGATMLETVLDMVRTYAYGGGHPE